MAGEEWARRILQKALNRAVHIHDDNSQPSMYDLRIGPADSPDVAIECVGAVNRTYTETWNVGPAKGSITLPIAGNWTVEISPGARVKTVKQRPQLPHKSLGCSGARIPACRTTASRNRCKKLRMASLIYVEGKRRANTAFRFYPDQDKHR
jgi:hypothetical protein